MTITVKTNGYQADDLQTNIALFNKATEKLFPNCTVEHFYYGDNIDMADIYLNDEGKHYAQYTITRKVVSLGGYTCTHEQLETFMSMTMNDWLYNGKLAELAQ